MTFASNNSDFAFATHGGRVYEAARRWGVHPEEVIDFSANINPLGAPPGVRDAIAEGVSPANIHAYPDDCVLASALAARHNVAPDIFIVANGAAALVFAVLRALLPSRVLILDPAFDEYVRACSAVKAEVTRLQLTEETGFAPDFADIIRAVEEHRFDLVILNSPHNPTGRLYSKADLLELIERAEAKNVAVLLDEAFIDYAPRASLLNSAPEKSRFIVLRSLTKFYAMPGLRVGYAACGNELAAAVRKQIEEWPISMVALLAARAALFEEEFEERSRRVNEQAREEFAEALRRIGMTAWDSSANFLLAKVPRGSGAELARWLEPERILIRRCDSFRGLGAEYIRLAVRSSADNLRLAALIETWLDVRQAGGLSHISGGHF